MPIDPNIALSVKPLQVESPINALSQALHVQGLQRQNALGDMQLREQQAVSDERNALRGFFQQNANLDDPATQAKLYGVAPTQAGGILKGLMDQRKAGQDIAESKAKTNKENVEAGVKAMGAHRSMLSMVSGPDQADAWIDAAYSNPALQPIVGKFGTPEQMKERMRQFPGGFEAWKTQNALGAEKYIEQNKPNIQIRNTGGTTDVISTPGLGGPAQVVSSVANTQSPDSRASQGTQMQIATLHDKTQRDIAGIDANGAGTDTGGLLSPESIINAAARYNMDGTLPPNLGRGTQGPRQTAQILNEAARQAAARGDTPEAQRIAQLANKANSTALNKLETQQTMVGAFEKNFIKNASIVEELSNKVDRTGVPVLNKWINAGKRAVQGDPEIVALDASIKATVNEYAKIVGGGTGSSATAQGEIAKIEGLLSAAQTKQQVKSVLDLMRRETQNRMTAFDDQKTELKNSMIPANKTPKPASAAGGVPSDIADILKKHGGK